jgi:hypothetical protein
LSENSTGELTVNVGPCRSTGDTSVAHSKARGQFNGPAASKGSKHRFFTAIKRLFDESATDLKARLITIYAVLAVLNIGAWAWALIAFHDNSTLLGVALLIYSLGLRHAVDADHIAAIDNVTRKLIG